MVIDDGDLDGLADALDELSVLHRAEPLVMRVGRSWAPEVGVVVDILHRAPTVTVVEGDPDEVPPAVAEAADVCLTQRPDATAPWVTGGSEGIAAAVAAQPLAALALATLLRAATGSGVWEALAAESATYGMLLGSAPHRAWLDDRGPRTPRPAARSPVRVERHADAVEITLDRPEVRNAVDRAMREALVEALAVVAVDPTIESVTLAGAGRCFSAGGDLDEFGTVADGATAFAVRLARHPGWAVHRVAGRVTAVVHGPCVGAGVEIPAFAHRVVAAPDATFRLPELGMGLVPGAGGTVSVRDRIGRQRTGWLALTGQAIAAPTARAWGLVDEIR